MKLKIRISFPHWFNLNFRISKIFIILKILEFNIYIIKNYDTTKKVLVHTVKKI